MDVVNDLRTGKVKPEDLNPDLFKGTKDKLLSGAEKGLKVKFKNVDYSTPDYNFLTEVRKNVYAFAGAKTYQHLRAINDLLIDDKGRVVSFGDFEKKVDQYRFKVMGLEDKYNRDWLRTEYDTCVAQAQNAVMWHEFMKNIDIFPCLKYVTVGDERVRHSHAMLDGIIRPKNDPIWLKIAPIKEWGCRCHLEETEEDSIGVLPEGFDPDPAFEGNQPQDGSLLPKKHPYFSQNGIDKNAIIEKTEGYWSEERKRINQKIYADYGNDPNYIREQFDNKTGGFVVRHRNSQFPLDRIPEAKRGVIDLLVKKGNRVILPEYYKTNASKNFDFSVDFSDWNMAEISGNLNRKSEERIREAIGQERNVILRFVRRPDINALKKALGSLSTDDLLNAVIIAYKKEIAVISKAEILRDAYTPLEVFE